MVRTVLCAVRACTDFRTPHRGLCGPLCALLLATAAHAGPRTSANYSITADTADSGGARTTSGNYTNDASAGGVAGLSTVASPAETSKSGYIGQLYDITGLVLNAGSGSVNETATLQLAAWHLLDDATFLAVSAGSVTWGVTSGPITGISAGGIATAGVVYQNTPATVQGSFGGFTGALNLTVLDTIRDNFGSYAGDGVGDDWQVQYFGLNNPDAAPNVDFDRTGQTNFFKYVAGLNPLDRNAPDSIFSLAITKVPGQPGRKNLTFSPVVAGRTYVIKAKADLNDPAWSAITASAPSDSGTTRTITDLSAGSGMKYYRIEITKP